MHLRSAWWLFCNYTMNLNPHQNMEKPEFVGYDHSLLSPKISHLFPSETRAVLHGQMNERVHSPAYAYWLATVLGVMRLQGFVTKATATEIHKPRVTWGWAAALLSWGFSYSWLALPVLTRFSPTGTELFLALRKTWSMDWWWSWIAEHLETFVTI